MHTDSLGRIQFNLEVSFHGIKILAKEDLLAPFLSTFLSVSAKLVGKLFFSSTILKAQQERN